MYFFSVGIVSHCFFHRIEFAYRCKVVVQVSSRADDALILPALNLVHIGAFIVLQNSTGRACCILCKMCHTLPPSFQNYSSTPTRKCQFGVASYTKIFLVNLAGSSLHPFQLLIGAVYCPFLGQ